MNVKLINIKIKNIFYHGALLASKYNSRVISTAFYKFSFQVGYLSDYI